MRETWLETVSQKPMAVCASESPEGLGRGLPDRVLDPWGGGGAGGPGQRRTQGWGRRGRPAGKLCRSRHGACGCWLSSAPRARFSTSCHTRGAAAPAPHPVPPTPASIQGAVSPGQGSAFVLGLQCRAGDHPGGDGHGRTVREPERRRWGAGQAGRTEPKDSREWREASTRRRCPTPRTAGEGTGAPRPGEQGMRGQGPTAVLGPVAATFSKAPRPQRGCPHGHHCHLPSPACSSDPLRRSDLWEAQPREVPPFSG